MQQTQVRSLGWEAPLEKEMAPSPVFLPGKSMDRGAWWATVSPWDHKRVGNDLETEQQLMDM